MSQKSGERDCLINYQLLVVIWSEVRRNQSNVDSVPVTSLGGRSFDTDVRNETWNDVSD